MSAVGGLNVTWVLKDVGAWGCLQQAQTVHGLDCDPRMTLHRVSFNKKPQGCSHMTDRAYTQEELQRLKAILG